MKDGLQYNYRGKYKVLRPLAEGGMGSVYLAEQLGISGFSKTVAIKVIKKEWTDRTLFRELLRLFIQQSLFFISFFVRPGIGTL